MHAGIHPGQVHPRAGTPPRRAGTPPPTTITAADGTHPTGMPFCIISNISIQLRRIIVQINLINDSSPYMFKIHFIGAIK